MAYFNKARNIEASIIEYLTQCFSSEWSSLGINVVKGYSNAYQSNLPVVAVGLDDVDTAPVEIGSTAINKTYYFNIDIFARNDGEKIDIVDYLLDILRRGCDYLEQSYESGSYENIITSVNGRVGIKLISNNSVEFGDTKDSKDAFRYYINISANHYV